MSNNSTPKTRRGKARPGRPPAKPGKAKAFTPAKPYPDFPLQPHSSGAWMKRINGRLKYFGRWGKRVNGELKQLPDPEYWQPALSLFQAQREDLYAGRTPRVRKTGEGLLLKDLCNSFLTAKQRKLAAKAITQQTFDGYKKTTDLLITEFGRGRLVDDIAADDFGELRSVMARRWGPVRLGNEIVKVRSVFKYGYDCGAIVQPVRYGPEFTKPSASVLRRHRAKNGERMLEADELTKLIDAAPVQMKAMILLGINCGFNNKDCADLPLTALDLDGGWINFPRPKTGIPRRCRLWPETIEALQAAIAERIEPRQDAAEGLVFITTRGRHWISRGQANPVSVVARDLMKSVGIHRKGIGFATLRHVFRTVADGGRDQIATNQIMGHSDPSMRAVYRERIEDERLVAVTDYVHNWLYGQRG